MYGTSHMTHFECLVIASGYRSLNLLLFHTWVSFTTLNLRFGFWLLFILLCCVFFFFFERVSLRG